GVDPLVLGEARASATFRGKKIKELTAREHQKALEYNQALSEKRRDAIVNRLKRTITKLNNNTEPFKDQFKIEAVGATKATQLGEENVYERRCEIKIIATDVEKAIEKLFGKRWHWWKQ
ncbi:MAG: hypothetical protein K0S68_1125, partial [Candidatus Saccharibacteria bacterium]|nr:hypothetical protein [Candidatus Saccharibacteria bacterium]